MNETGNVESSGTGIEENTSAQPSYSQSDLDRAVAKALETVQKIKSRSGLRRSQKTIIPRFCLLGTMHTSAVLCRNETGSPPN